MAFYYWAPLLFLLCLTLLYAATRTVNQYERGVIFQLGRANRATGPGVKFVLPLFSKLKKVDVRTVTESVPAQDVITRDNVSVRVSAVVYYRVTDPVKALLEVEDYKQTTSQLAQTTLRSICGQDDLDHMLSERDAVNDKMQQILDQETDPWGVKVNRVEIKEIDLPGSMQRAMAKQAEAERERRAAIINADGELQAAAKLCEAAACIDREPAAIQLRYLQTIREIGTTKKSSSLIPLQMELFQEKSES